MAVIQEYKFGKTTVQIHDDCLPQSIEEKEQREIELANTVWSILQNQLKKEE
ncbi:hypothetical protein [Paenibacillus larvae]|uniref:hypothetical protein n=1 Tax=Paenibacillus larvae TaxID=1464 RepID=UPI001314E37A|nr:hypothetical protein [Paenibacillus larvae]